MDEPPRPKSGEKTVPQGNLQNQRTALAQYFAGKREVITLRDLIRARYDDKIKWFQENYVSYIKK